MTALSSTVEQGRHMHSNGAFVFTCTDLFINVRKSNAAGIKIFSLIPKQSTSYSGLDFFLKFSLIH
jgi:hypothetical protein